MARPRRRLRPSPEARGYDRNHKLLRKQFDVEVQAGGVNCARCGKPIRPGEPWDLGHNDHDRRLYVGPEHRACNRATAGRRAPEPPKHSRRW